MSADAQHGVLVVDDDERFAVTLAMALARRGYVTHVAHDAAAALATARSKEPDAAIVDLKLGADDGLVLTEALRRASLNAHHRVDGLREHRDGRQSHQARRGRLPREARDLQRVLAENDGNISETARALRMPPNAAAQAGQTPDSRLNRPTRSMLDCQHAPL